MVEGQNDSFSAALKGHKRYQTMTQMLALLCSAMHALRNYIEKAMLDVGRSTESVFTS